MTNYEAIKKNISKMDPKTLAALLLVISNVDGELVYMCSDGTFFPLTEEKKAYEYEVWWLKQEQKDKFVN